MLVDEGLRTISALGDLLRQMEKWQFEREVAERIERSRKKNNA